MHAYTKQLPSAVPSCVCCGQRMKRWQKAAGIRPVSHQWLNCTCTVLASLDSMTISVIMTYTQSENGTNKSKWQWKWRSHLNLGIILMRCLVLQTICVVLSSVVSDSLWARRLWSSRLFCPWDFSGNKTRRISGVGRCSHLQGVFPTQG